VENRPGLSRIDYRVGRYADFRASLIERLSGTRLSTVDGALGQLRTRDPGDFTVALLDCFAVVCDVLTFHTERLAGESYLRTATDPVSMRELGRLIAYRVRPGVAASTHLAFRLQPPGPTTPEALTAPDTAPPAGPDLVTLDRGIQVRSVPGPGEQPQTFETVERIVARPSWSALPGRRTVAPVLGTGRTSLHLDGTATNLKRGDVLLFTGNADHFEIRALASVTVDAPARRTFVTWHTGLTSGGHTEVYALRKRVGVFGANAPMWLSMSEEFRKHYPTGATVTGALAAEVMSGVLTASTRWTVAAGEVPWPGWRIGPDGKVDLDGSHPDVVVDGYAVLTTGEKTALFTVTAVNELSRAEYAVSGKVTRLTLTGKELDHFKELVRETVVLAVSERLTVVEEPDPSAVTGPWLDVDAPVTDLPAGRVLLVTGRDTGGVPHAEVVTLKQAEPAGPDRTRLVLTGELTGVYERGSVMVYANVVRASHGETVQQLLGGGDAAQPFQRFALRQAPVTYTPSDVDSGATSTVRVFVNDVEWHERPTLYQAGAHEQVFVTRTDETGQTLVEFGDGRHGARPPTGLSNIRALYRKGIGSQGNVVPGALSQPIAPPLGVSAVVSPLAATGGADPDGPDQARRSMPLAVRTLGRAVSLTDYADYARAFAGVELAQAGVLNLAGGRTIVVTVAAAGGQPVPEEVCARLADSLRGHGDPRVRVAVVPYRDARFRLAAGIVRDPDRSWDAVAARIRDAVAARFGFTAREFGQPVHRSDVVTTIQRVPGVVAVDLDRLYRPLPHPVLLDRARPPAKPGPLPERGRLAEPGALPGPGPLARPGRLVGAGPEPLGWPWLPGLWLRERLLAAPASVSAGNPVPAELLRVADDPFDWLREMS
jgi:hypothetical protein